MPANCTAPIHTTDAAALTHAVARGVPEPDTLSSTCDSAHAPRYARPPIPRTLHDAKVVRSKGAVIFDHAALSPTLAAMGQEYGASSADDMDQQQRDQRYRVYGGTNSSGMAVGPNPSSAQSSPAPNRVSSKCPSASPSPPSS
ncbi:hypothetical protein IWW50_004513 [Coemansia erecta]|nr:hypothetical protein IWW50_004513 [Coemansia erecta]